MAKRFQIFEELKKNLSEAREKFSRSFQDCIDLKKNAAIAIQRSFKRYRRKKRSGPIVVAEEEYNEKENMLPFAFKTVGVGSTINLNGKRRGKMLVATRRSRDWRCIACMICIS